MTDPIKAEPVAWMYQWRNEHPVYLSSRRDWADFPNNANADWTETPLYTEAQLVEERRLAWNEAIEAAAKKAEWAHMVPPDGGSPSDAEKDVADNAAAAIRALTKDSTHD